MKDDDKTPATLLAQLGQALKTCQDVDTSLAEIVAEHILTAAPAEDCLEQAMTAITALAAARATHPMENADG
jgi:hypothetical protein